MVLEKRGKMSEHKYDFEITMTCGGCSGAVDRVLKKLEGEFSVSALQTCPAMKPLTSSEARDTRATAPPPK